jgi:hypothetical protein
MSDKLVQACKDLELTKVTTASTAMPRIIYWTNVASTINIVLNDDYNNKFLNEINSIVLELKELIIT